MVTDHTPAAFLVMTITFAAGEGPTSFLKFGITCEACDAFNANVTLPSGRTVGPGWLGPVGTGWAWNRGGVRRAACGRCDGSPARRRRSALR